MGNTSHSVTVSSHNRFIRICGVGSLTAIVVHFLVNAVFKEFPAADLDVLAMKKYFSDQQDTWALVHGLRYFALAGIVLMLSGLYVRTRPDSTETHPGWQLVGLLGGAMWLANLAITNAIELFAFLDFELLSEDLASFWLLFYLTRVLFTAEVFMWSVVIFGFSMAGLTSHRLPRWLTISGIVIAAAGFVNARAVPLEHSEVQPGAHEVFVCEKP